MIKVGIIGCGGIANGKHMPALKKVEDVEMVAFCDIIAERAEKAFLPNDGEPVQRKNRKVYEKWAFLLCHF